jgi:hypothetical protein
MRSVEPSKRAADAERAPPVAGPMSRAARSRERVRAFIDAVREGDESMAEEAILRLSQSRRWLAPLALAASAFATLFDGLKLVFTNWRLTIVQVLPAMWVWLAMFDLKVHALHGASFRVLRGPIVIPIVIGVAAVTMACFFLNAVFAFAIATPGPPRVRPGFASARGHLPVVLGSGAIVGVLLGLSTVVVTRWGKPWFALSLGIVLAVMMISYVAVPSRLIGMKALRSRRDRLAATAVSGAIGTVVCTPPYLLGRVGILMLGSKVLLVPGIVLVVLGFTLQAGATGAVKAIKMSTKLVAGHRLVSAGSPGSTDGRDHPVEAMRPARERLSVGSAQAARDDVPKPSHPQEGAPK